MYRKMIELILKTPIGVIKTEHTSNGVHSITMDRSYNEIQTIIEKDFTNNVVEIVAISGKDTKNVQFFIDWMKSFFSDKPFAELPPVDNSIVEKDNFTGLVLRTLMNKTSCGATLSYAELAGLCNNPKACRAVGQAMRANPIPLIVPCHRVVGSNGKLGHYMSSKGDNIKAWLIEHERHCTSVQ